MMINGDKDVLFLYLPYDTLTRVSPEFIEGLRKIIGIKTAPRWGFVSSVGVTPPFDTLMQYISYSRQASCPLGLICHCPSISISTSLDVHSGQA